MQRDALVTIIGDGDIVIDFEDTGHHSTGRAVRGRPMGREMRAGEVSTNFLS